VRPSGCGRITRRPGPIWPGLRLSRASDRIPGPRCRFGPFRFD
jgi:hypothetical protein